MITSLGGAGAEGGGGGRERFSTRPRGTITVLQRSDAGVPAEGGGGGGRGGGRGAVPGSSAPLPRRAPVVRRALVSHALRQVRGEEAPFISHAVRARGLQEQAVLLLRPLALGLQRRAAGPAGRMGWALVQLRRGGEGARRAEQRCEAAGRDARMGAGRALRPTPPIVPAPAPAGRHTPTPTRTCCSCGAAWQ